MAQDLSRFPELHVLETRILARLSEDVPLRVILDDITLTVDRLMADVRSSILLVENGFLRHGSGPNLPAAYNAAIDGKQIGEKEGSCGSAAWSGKQVIVVDTLTDPLWENYRDLAVEHDLRASWSTPVLAADEHVLATFAIYHAKPRAPNQAEINFIKRISHFVRVAVERAQQQETLNKARFKLAQLRQLESLGQLTGGIAHDFNNLLTGIIHNSELLESTLSPDPQQHEYLQKILYAARRGSVLSAQLLAFGSKQSLKPVIVNLRDTIERIGAQIERTLGPDITTQFKLNADVWPVMIDPAQLESAVLNICLNARDAMQQGGCLTIESANVSIVEQQDVTLHEIPLGHYVRLVISDTGIGMDIETTIRAFEPFFSRKPEGLNHGMGLSMVYGFIRQSRGHVRLNSELGRGTSIHLYIPRYEHREAM